MVDETRRRPSYRGQPVLFNEDDHYGFDQPDNNMLAAISKYASWGLFDWRMEGEAYDDGFQSVPVNWAIRSERKRGFFGLLAELTGTAAAVRQTQHAPQEEEKLKRQERRGAHTRPNRP